MNAHAMVIRSITKIKFEAFLKNNFLRLKVVRPDFFLPSTMYIYYEHDSSVVRKCPIVSKNVFFF